MSHTMCGLLVSTTDSVAITNESWSKRSDSKVRIPKFQIRNKFTMNFDGSSIGGYSTTDSVALKSNESYSNGAYFNRIFQWKLFVKKKQGLISRN